MQFDIFSIEKQHKGAFDNGAIIENKPLAFPQESGRKPYSNIFYWSNASSEKGGLIDLHPHKGFEIVSVILKGTIQHYDTANDKWFELNEGDVQLIKAGSGISHAEKLLPGSRLFQIWFDPGFQNSFGKPPEYKDFDKEKFRIEDHPEYTSVIINTPDSGLSLDSPGVIMKDTIYNAGSFKKSKDPDNYITMYVIQGSFTLNGKKVKKDDCIIVHDTDLEFDFTEQTRLFTIQSPEKVPYKRFHELF